MPIACVSAAALCGGHAPPSHACGTYSFPAEETRVFRIEQDARERAFIADTLDDADTIVVAESLGSEQLDYNATGEATATFRTERVLKGRLGATFSARWRHPAPLPPATVITPQGESVTTFKYSCWPDDGFGTVDFNDSSGWRYLLYLKNGVVLRANQFPMGPEYISAEKEVLMILSGTH